MKLGPSAETGRRHCLRSLSGSLGLYAGAVDGLQRGHVASLNRVQLVQIRTKVDVSIFPPWRRWSKTKLRMDLQPNFDLQNLSDPDILTRVAIEMVPWKALSARMPIVKRKNLDFLDSLIGRISEHQETFTELQLAQILIAFAQLTNYRHRAFTDLAGRVTAEVANEHNAVHLLKALKRLNIPNSTVPLFDDVCERVASEDVYLSEESLAEVMLLHRQHKCITPVLFDHVIERLTLRFDYFTEDQFGDVCRAFRDLRYRDEAFVRLCEQKLPFKLHEYRYWNLIDIAEMYQALGIGDTEMKKRFALESWRAVPSLQGDYFCRALRVLVLMEVGNRRDFYTLIHGSLRSLRNRHVTADLAADSLISAASINYNGKRADNFFYRMSAWLGEHIWAFSSPSKVCDVVCSLALVQQPQEQFFAAVAERAALEPRFFHVEHLISLQRDLAFLGRLNESLLHLTFQPFRCQQLRDCSPAALSLVPAVCGFWRRELQDRCDVLPFIREASRLLAEPGAYSFVPEKYAGRDDYYAALRRRLEVHVSGDHLLERTDRSEIEKNHIRGNQGERISSRATQRLIDASRYSFTLRRDPSARGGRGGPLLSKFQQMMQGRRLRPRVLRGKRSAVPPPLSISQGTTSSMFSHMRMYETPEGVERLGKDAEVQRQVMGLHLSECSPESSLLRRGRQSPSMSGERAMDFLSASEIVLMLRGLDEMRVYPERLMKAVAERLCGSEVNVELKAEHLPPLLLFLANVKEDSPSLRAAVEGLILRTSHGLPDDAVPPCLFGAYAMGLKGLAFDALLEKARSSCVTHDGEYRQLLQMVALGLRLDSLEAPANGDPRSSVSSSFSETAWRFCSWMEGMETSELKATEGVWGRPAVWRPQSGSAGEVSIRITDLAWRPEEGIDRCRAGKGRGEVMDQIVEAMRSRGLDAVAALPCNPFVIDVAVMEGPWPSRAGAFSSPGLASHSVAGGVWGLFSNEASLKDPVETARESRDRISTHTVNSSGGSLHRTPLDLNGDGVDVLVQLSEGGDDGVSASSFSVEDSRAPPPILSREGQLGSQPRQHSVAASWDVSSEGGAAGWTSGVDPSAASFHVPPEGRRWGTALFLVESLGDIEVRELTGLGQGKESGGFQQGGEQQEEGGGAPPPRATTAFARVRESLLQRLGWQVAYLPVSDWKQVEFRGDGTGTGPWSGLGSGDGSLWELSPERGEGDFKRPTSGVFQPKFSSQASCDGQESAERV